jgi:DNA repair exonuclease SbcCD nuclease subunit
MKLLLLSDIHANSKNPVGRRDSIIDAFKDKFSFVLKYAEDNNCVVLQAGDFLDRSRDWHILYLMIKLLNKYKVRLFSIPGQHDMYMRGSTPTTMSVLNRFGLIEILNKNPIKIGDVYLYGCGWDSSIPVPKKEGINILVIHASITTKAVYPGHDFTAIQHFLKKNKGWDLVLVGDIHIQSIYNPKDGGTIVVNTGPMLRLASTQYNLTHHPCFFIYDIEKHSLKQIEIPHKPAKDVLTRDHLNKIKRREDILSERSLARFARLMTKKQNKPSLTLKQVMQRIMRKRKTSRLTRELLLGIMNED